MKENTQRVLHRIASWLGIPGLLVGLALPVLDKFIESAPETPASVVIVILVISAALVGSKPLTNRMATLIEAWQDGS